MPVVISKQLFDELNLSNFTCTQFLHPSTNSCFKALLQLLVQTSIGTPKFFLLIYMLQSIIKWRNIKSNNFIKKQLNAYIRSVVYGLLYGINFAGFICLMRKCTGKFYFYTMAIGGLCAGLSIFVESEENRSLNTAIYINLVTETFFRYAYWKSFLTRTKSKETFIFMTCSAALMYLLKTQKPDNKITNLWKVFMFYYPTRIKLNPQDTNKGACTHGTSCCNYFYEGFTKYFIFGYVLQLLKYLLPRINKIIFNPRSIMQAVLSKDHFLFGLLIGSYVGIYRAVSCFLKKKDNTEKPLHSAVAGFLAGSAYIFKPTLPIIAIAFTTTLQLLVQRITYINNLLSKMPLREIIFALCSGVLIHSRFFLPDACPRYVKTMLNTISNGLIDNVYGHALQLAEERLAKSTLS